MPSSHSCVASAHRIRRTIIGHLTGRVIWDSSKPSCCKRPKSSHTSLSARCKRHGVNLLEGLGFGNGGD
jgi:hypothetical protein